MRLTRRTALVSAILALCAHAHAAETYENPAIGVAIDKPPEWHFATAEQNAENLKNTKLSSEEYQALLLKYATTPLVAMTKYPEPYDDLNPSVKVNIKPYGGLDRTDPKLILKLVLPTFEQMFEGFQVEQDPIDTTISGIESGYMRVSYSLKVGDGRVFDTTSELWIVPRGDHFFMIGAGTRSDELTGTRDEIKSIIETVSIRH